MSAAPSPRRVPLVLAAAQRYVGFGWRVVPVPRGQKNPVIPGWERWSLTADELPYHFRDNTNVGIITGSISGELTDVDCDVPEAVALANEYLPGTGRIHGRPGNPRSHWWYYAQGSRYEKFALPERDVHGRRRGGTCLIELRSDGDHEKRHLTIAPPSVHPNGEVYAWDERSDPARVDAQTLRTAVTRVAAGAAIARAWPGKGSRDDAALALAGWLLRSGWSAEESDQFVVAVARAAGDDEACSCAKATRSQEALKNKEPVYGKPKLIEVLTDGATVVEHVEQWLGLTSTRAHGPALRDDNWDTPLPLSGDMPPVPALDMAMLPAALALLFHLIDCDPAEPGYVAAVGEEATVRAATWCDEYLEHHAVRVYASAAHPGLERASNLLKHIKRGEVPHGCTVRDIYAHGWERLRTSDEAKDALRILEDYGWVRSVQQDSGPQGGRPPEVVYLHPSLRTAEPTRGDDDDDE